MSTTLSRRTTLIAAAAALASAPWASLANNPQKLPVMQVWKDPNCGCCKDWVEILRKAGFEIQTFDTGNTAMRTMGQRPMKMADYREYLRVLTALLRGETPAPPPVQRLADPCPHDWRG